MVVRHVLIAAGGTGGHVYPALAVARKLQDRGIKITWLGTTAGLESRVVPEAGFDFEIMGISGLRGKGVKTLLLVPFKLVHAVYQVLRVFARTRPDSVLGMGGFVTGPAGIASVLSGKSLYLHEQNAIPGLTNRVLSRFATKVMQAFPGSFKKGNNLVVTGNPVREEITAIDEPEERMSSHRGAIRILIVGGSLGAQALNEIVPKTLAAMENDIEIWHQAGKNKLQQTIENYNRAGVEAKITEFIEDIAAAYKWADLVICRAGALTISELANAGVASILVPYPYAVDDHQTKNAAYLAEPGAAVLIQQNDLETGLVKTLTELLQAGREKLLSMAKIARTLAMPEATDKVAGICLGENNG